MASLSNMKNKKRCLLIGNSDYKRGRTLQYSLNNVNDLEEKLSKLDFEVTIGKNSICEEMDLLFENFVKDISPNDLIVLFYCGYGIHLENENYFLPIDDEQISDPKMFEYQSIHVQTIVQMIMDRRPSGAIFLFQSSNPYCIEDQTKLNLSVDYGGFRPMEALANSLLMFSCDADKTILEKSINGRNSIFVSFLLQYIDQTNLSIDELMDCVSDEIINQSDHQIFPFKISLIRKNLYFNDQIQSEISERRSLLIEEMIVRCQNGSLFDLKKKELIDRDLKIVIEKVFLQKQLTRLWLDGNHFTPIGASILASALNSNTSLERLYLSANSISDIGVKYLSKTLSTANKTLKILALQDNQITDLGIEHLSQMIEKNTTLTSLSLDSNRITDKGIRSLTKSLINSKSSIEYLSLSNNQLITDLSFNYFKDLIQFNRSINEISLHHCSLSKITKENLQKMSRLKKGFSIYLNNWNE